MFWIKFKSFQIFTNFWGKFFASNVRKKWIWYARFTDQREQKPNQDWHQFHPNGNNHSSLILLNIIFYDDYYFISTCFFINCYRFYESATLCTVSHQNCLAFVSSYPLVPACTVPNDDELPIPLLPQKSQLPERAGASSSVYRRFNEFSEIDNNLTHGQHYVYVCDMNTPWDVHLVRTEC